MEMLLFSGVQAAGKSTFFKSRFVDSHIRLNLDMLRTRHRERLLLAACLEAKQPFVVENTNLTVEDRADYILRAKRVGFRVVGYRFHVPLDVALTMNAKRQKPVPEKAIRAAFKNWQPLGWAEGFDTLFDVTAAGGDFMIVEVLHAQ